MRRRPRCSGELRSPTHHKRARKRPELNAATPTFGAAANSSQPHKHCCNTAQQTAAAHHKNEVQDATDDVEPRVPEAEHVQVLPPQPDGPLCRGVRRGAGILALPCCRRRRHMQPARGWRACACGMHNIREVPRSKAHTHTVAAAKYVHCPDPTTSDKNSPVAVIS